MGRKLFLAIGVAVLSMGGMAAAAEVTPRLAYSTASNSVVQPQPAAGTCHPIGTGLYSRPDPHCTPGALDPAVTQADIGRTICHAGWTATIRPPEAITEAEKRASMLAYGDARPLRDYEYDHFVPLELGGATNAAANLWPEPGASPNPKDRVEDELNRAVCDHRLSLAKAQEEDRHQLGDARTPRHLASAATEAPTGANASEADPAEATPAAATTTTARLVLGQRLLEQPVRRL